MTTNTIEYLKHCDDLYYNNGESSLSDTDYDKLKTSLFKKYPNDSYFKTVGYEPKSKKVLLPYTMGSLKKKKYDGSVLKWMNDYQYIIIMDKLDGCSIYVEYDKGKVVFASTRGNGTIGQDITEKAKIFCPVIAYTKSLYLKGEAMMLPETAKTISEKHSRNIVAGILNRDDNENVNKIIPVFYGILNKKFNHFLHELENIDGYGLRTPYFSPYSTKDLTEEMLLSLLMDRKKSCSYNIDGLVLADINYQHSSEYYPDNMIAFKVNEESVKTNVIDIEWNVTRTGKITPVVLIEPVEIGGSTISRVTGFNARYIVDNGINKNAEIGIVKSGDIIPYITDVYKKVDFIKLNVPVNCPSCKTELVWSNTNIDLYCNHKHCNDQLLYKIEHFLNSHDVEEIGIPTLKQIKVKSIEGLFEIDEFDLLGLDGIGSRKASIILNQIKKVLKTTPENLLKSFGINGIGKTISKDIVERWSFDELFTLSKDDFISIDGIGEILADNLVKGLKENFKLYEFLKKQGLKFKKQNSNLKGMIFTLTGKSEFKRNDLIKMIESEGAQVKGISKKVNFLVTNNINTNSTKMKKAIKYGVNVITYDDLLNMIG
jgi:DNA ligase (NAD+)